MRYQNTQAKKQFIAGAVCPACKSIDTVLLHSYPDDAKSEMLECVACGYQETRPEMVLNQTNTELDTQLNVGIVKFK